MDTRDGRIYEVPAELRKEKNTADEAEIIGEAEARMLDIPGVEKVDLEYIKPMTHHPTPIQRARRKVGRNECCPCGSGKKFKKCCLFGAKS